MSNLGTEATTELRKVTCIESSTLNKLAFPVRLYFHKGAAPSS
jgi:hypothetical protein